ncbi:Lon protease family protein [Alkalicoccus saliphilus]|uniref:endopeptidase La n=1 Tax=Alkalicoccus saliphilus TaxID=200989 RepID=A0A2T4U8R4_9BACI|nr:AAA family ATPase [Alkalicoccus saliphilus]PTL39794.1 ATP-dependent protease [Alkalicoccus saliphilus]
MNTEEFDQKRSSHRLPPEKLRSECRDDFFDFATTDDIGKCSIDMIGQKRAEQAMSFGLAVEQNGYNLFVVGPAGTGRMTYTQGSVSKMAESGEVPRDWGYVHNFDNHDRPVVISFEAGKGHEFRRDMEILLMDIEREIRSAFTSDGYEKQKRKMIDEFRRSVEQLWKEAEVFAGEHHYKIERSPGGINTIPLIDGKPISIEEFKRLSPQQKEHLKEQEKLLEDKLQETVLQIQKKEDQLRKSVHAFMKEITSNSVKSLFIPLKEKYYENKKVGTYLDAYYSDVVEHFHFFFSEEEEQETVLNALAGPKEKPFLRYAVNLFVNNKGLEGAPVIYETNPTYQNLFGKVEYQGQLGNLITDFTMIKPGALHLANGGYLILQASELLQHPYAWTGLKRALQSGNIPIENPNEDRGLFPASAIKPEPIPLNVKIIIIGSYYIYELLSRLDEDFDKLFKVKVEFDTEMPKSDENNHKMACFIKNYAEDEGLLPFHRRAVADVINYSSRLVDEKTKLTTRFQDITKLLVESSFYAKEAEEEIVDKPHIQKALFEKTQRSNHVPEKFREMIHNGTIMIETKGRRIGQINGLAVMGTRDSLFGIPTKITAQTFAGKNGIVNIERETAMSGQIHHKGMMILTGFLSGQFAKNRPIPLSASITFEQTYTMIDGDSASSTELYVLLSSLAEVPIHQGTAVTGSVNQWGEIQPIGGVNEKVEGFYHICSQNGLTGEQGVIIPKQNVKNLMLDEEVVEAVRNGQFHIWAIGHIADGLEILTGFHAGYERNNNGEFPEGSIFARADERFSKMHEIAKEEREQLKE